MRDANRSRPDSSTSFAQRVPLHPWRPLDLFRDATTPVLVRTAIAVAVAWIPLAIFSAIHGQAALLSFLTDFATQSRFLIIVPVLILGDRPIHARYAEVAHHFEISLVTDNEQPRFQSYWKSYEKLIGSPTVRVLLLLVTYALAGWLSEYLRPEGSEFLLWWRGGFGFRSFSLAGTWALFVSYPILVYLTLLWIWR